MLLVNDLMETTHILLDEAVLYEAATPKEPSLPQPANKQLTSQSHLTHLEDLLILKGERGFSDVLNVMNKTFDYLHGRQSDQFSISTKFDGAPGILWGHKDGKFFVATKSFFNATPKINFTDKDIDVNHGHAPGLAKKLKAALKLLPEITPKKGIFRGDLMFSKEDLKTSDKDVSFTPNTLTYSVDKNTPEANGIQKAQIGIVPHMTYTELPNGDLKANFDSSLAKFKKSPNVHVFDPKVAGPHEFTSSQQKEFADNLKDAKNLMPKLEKLHVFSAIKDHEMLLMTYINHTIRERKTPSTAGYISFATNQFTKQIDKLKLEKAKEKVKKEMDDELYRINQNKEGINLLFKAHSMIQKSKKVIVDVLSKSSPYRESIKGKPSKPEGFVVSVKGQPIKLVDRKDFSQANFDNQGTPFEEDNKLVMSFGRFAPATIGHKKLIDKVEQLAKETGAKSKIVMTRTKDTKKNPLTPEQKLKWAKTLFPSKNISIAGENDGTLIAQLISLHKSGVKDLTLVCGEDRLKNYQDIIKKYNGTGENSLFNFKNIHVVNAGHRDSNSKDPLERVSASAMRDAAKKDDMKKFSSMVPNYVSKDSINDLYHNLRAEMGEVKIDDKTSGIALAIFAKRAGSDKIGSEARKEIEKRKKTGKWTGK